MDEIAVVLGRRELKQSESCGSFVMGIRFPWRIPEDPWVLPLWVACGADGNIIATRRFQVVWLSTVLRPDAGRGGRARIRH